MINVTSRRRIIRLYTAAALVLAASLNLSCGFKEAVVKEVTKELKEGPLRKIEAEIDSVKKLKVELPEQIGLIINSQETKRKITTQISKETTEAIGKLNNTLANYSVAIKMLVIAAMGCTEIVIA